MLCITFMPSICKFIKYMFKKLDTDAWKRKPQYDFFKTYDNPFFNITADVNVDNLVDFCKKNNESFFLNSLYIGAKVNNEIDEFRMRIRGDEVIIHDIINFGAPVMHKDKTFTFCFFKYYANREEFIKNAEESLKLELANPSFNPRHNEDDIIHFSVLPWINFTSIQHARRIPVEDSIPKIVYGKYREKDGEFSMPISLEVHHGLMDGYHAGLFYEKWQKIESEFK